MTAPLPTLRLSKPRGIRTPLDHAKDAGILTAKLAESEEAVERLERELDEAYAVIDRLRKEA